MLDNLRPPFNMRPMLERLLVRDFRCFVQAELPLHPSATLLVGDNAQGKTSLLEALCVLLRLQSPRTSSRTELIRFNATSCLIEGFFPDRKLRFAQSATVRRLAVDDAVISRSADYLLYSSLVVWMDHADMHLVRGGAEHRRRFLDFAASQLYPGYLQALRHYDRILRSRNHLLKKESQVNWRQADAYAVALEHHGALIRSARQRLVDLLRPHVIQAHRQLSSRLESADLHLVPGSAGTSLAQQLRDARDEEERTRSTAAGPHRDDLLLEVQGRAAAAFASEGQQRTLCLSLKLAQIHALEQGFGRPPLVLMDDVFGELDKARRRALLAALPAHAQKVITTTFVDWLEDLPSFECLRWQVSGGTLSPA